MNGHLAREGGLEVNEDVTTFDGVDGAHGPRIVEMEVDIFASLSSDSWQLVLLSDRYGYAFA